MHKLKQTALAAIISATAIAAVATPPETKDNLINLNTASKEMLNKGISGLTATQADAIIAYRTKEGVFVKLHELHYAGIGREIIEPNYNKLTVGNVSTADKKPSRL